MKTIRVRVGAKTQLTAIGADRFHETHRRASARTEVGLRAAVRLTFFSITAGTGSSSQSREQNGACMFESLFYCRRGGQIWTSVSAWT